jgi:hypothetical protein
MASVYLSKSESNNRSSIFLLGERPLHEVIGQFGITPNGRETHLPDQGLPDQPLVIVVSVSEGEAGESGFQAGYYRATILPHLAMRRCGLGFSDILGSRLSG